MTNPRDLHIYLTLAQSGVILEALMERPFKQVFELIGDLNQQGQQFYLAGAKPNAPGLFVFRPRDLSLCVQALGDLPYNRVASLVGLLHQQLQAQQARLNSEQAGDVTASETGASGP